MGLSVAGGDPLTVPDAAASPTQPASGDSSPALDAGIDDSGNPLDATLADASLADASLAEGESQAAGEASVVDGPPVPPAPVSCSVTFTVADAFVDGVIDTVVALGGDTTALGDWDPDAAVPMTSIGAGAWTVSLVMNDGDAVQFLFLKRGPSSYVWEDWGVNSNRSLLVSCAPDPDASTPVDGGPVVGTSYAGQFGVKPPDAT
jgi:hypothetical protein